MNLLKLPGPASHIDRMQQIKIMTGSAAARVCRNSAEPAVKPELPSLSVRPMRQSHGYSDAHSSLIPAAISVSPVISASYVCMYGTTSPIFPFHSLMVSCFYFLFYPVSVLLSVLCRNAIFHILYLRYPLYLYSSLTPQASAIRAFP